MRPVRAPLLDRADLPTASKTDTAAYLHDYFTSRLEKSELHNPPAAPPIDDYLVVGADTGGTPSVNISKVGLPQVPKGKPSEMLLLDEVSLPEEVFDHVQNLAAEIESKTGIKPDIISLGKDVVKSMEDPNHVVTVKKASEGASPEKSSLAHGDFGPSPLEDAIGVIKELEWFQKKIAEGLAVPKEFFVESTPGAWKSSMLAGLVMKHHGSCENCKHFGGAIVDPLGGAPVVVSCGHEAVPADLAAKKYVKEAAGKYQFVCLGFVPCK